MARLQENSTRFTAITLSIIFAKKTDLIGLRV